MKSLSKEAQKVFEKLIEGLNRVGQARKIENSKVYMAVHIDRLVDSPLGPVYSVAHYFTQNGDSMADPDMTFLHARTDRKIYPMTYQLDSLGVYQYGAFFNAEGKLSFRARLQAEQTTFANHWMKNIDQQQNILMRGLVKS